MEGICLLVLSLHKPKVGLGPEIPEMKRCQQDVVLGGSQLPWLLHGPSPAYKSVWPDPNRLVAQGPVGLQVLAKVLATEV